MNKIIKLVLFLLINGCQPESGDDGTKVFLTTEKLPEKDGLYVNPNSDMLYIQYSNEVGSYFMESDSTKRKSQLYSEAYSLYKKRYKESFYELLPTDLNENTLFKDYDAIVIDTVNKKAYSTQIYRTTVLF